MIDLDAIGLERFQANAGNAARLLKSLSNENRLMILCQIGDSERQVADLLPLVGLSQSALSQHLARLRMAEVVTTRREAQSIFYAIADDRAGRILQVLAELFCEPEEARARKRRKK